MNAMLRMWARYCVLLLLVASSAGRALALSCEKCVTVTEFTGPTGEYRSTYDPGREMCDSTYDSLHCYVDSNTTVTMMYTNYVLVDGKWELLSGPSPYTYHPCGTGDGCG